VRLHRCDMVQSSSKSHTEKLHCRPSATGEAFFRSDARRCDRAQATRRPTDYVIDCRDQAGVNHGGIVIIAYSGVLLSPIDVGRPTSFELLAVRVVSGHLKSLLPSSTGRAPRLSHSNSSMNSPRCVIASLLPVSCLCCWRL
jgi:hypothetical protein